MNKTIETILDHRSVRKFNDVPLTKEQVKKLVLAAQSASSASFQQAYSIIGINQESVKEELKHYAGNQDFIVKNGHFFVFCADLYRHKVIADELGIDIINTIEGIDAVMVGTIDASLAAQNMAIAAESMGMGVCYVGAVRDGAVGISTCLGLPNHVLPIFGFAVGYPEARNEKKPRMPMNLIYHENHYESDKDLIYSKLSEYDNLMADYYKKRSNNKKLTVWTEHTLKKSLRHSRLFMKDFINEKGWAKH